MPHRISPSVQEQIRRRANSLCEYCHTDETWQYVRFAIDHIAPISEGGEDHLEKFGPRLLSLQPSQIEPPDGIRPRDGANGSDFNPREDQWSNHFIWSGDGLLIIPLTPIGRATVDLLELNRDRIQQIRLADMSVGRHPPFDDPVQPIG